MSYRNRLILEILLIGLVPWLVVLILGNRDLLQLRDSSGQLATDAIIVARQDTIKNKADDVAMEIQLYLEQNTSVDLNNVAVLQADQKLAGLAGQTIGKTGYTFLFNDKGISIFDQDSGLVGSDLNTLNVLYPAFTRMITSSFDGKKVDGWYDWKDISGLSTAQKYIAIAPVGNTPLRVGATVYRSEWVDDSSPVVKSINDKAGSIRLTHNLLVGLVGAIILALGIWRGSELSAPVKWMANTAMGVLRVMRSLFRSIEAPPKNDEVSVVSHTMGLMEKQVRDEFANMEKTIKARTGDLHQRTTQLETAAQIARESAGILDVQKLLDQAVRLISDRFGYYHSGIFLIDENNEFAVLKAANSEGGQRMLARGHKLRIGQSGIVGTVASKEEPIIVADVDVDSQYYNNPDLPRTRSEMALPLKAHGRVIGVLDVQSTSPNAFLEEDIRILGILADQIALAIENARLLDESKRALQELQTLYSDQAQRTWQERLERHPVEYQYTTLGVESVDPSEMSSIASQTDQAGDIERLIKVPISLRGQELGAVSLKRDPEERPWTEEDRVLVEDAVMQISQALENARLLEEIRRRAQNEQLIGQIAARTQSSLDLETVVRTAVQEIGLALNASRVQIRLGNHEPIPSVPENGGSGQ